MSGAVDEDTARAVATGRETIGAMLSSAQTHLQKVFIVFVLGFMGTFWALRVYIWDFLEETATAEMSAEVVDATDIITRTPFEVILLQAKIGLIVGAIVAVPALLYFSRDALKRRGVQSAVPISRGHVVALVAASLILFVVGVGYAYLIFFPFAFMFLGEVSHAAGVNPHWGITEFTEFVVLLTLSFGLAAQLPLAMSVLSYTEIVPYETFRDKWRHAIVAITIFGAFFSPPDPITLVMWALPLVALYVFSLGLAKLLANARRRGASEFESGTAHVKRRVLHATGALGLLTLMAALFINQDGLAVLERSVFPVFPEWAQPETSGIEAITLEYGLLGDLAVGGGVALTIGFVVLLGYTVVVLQSPVYPREDAIWRAESPDDVDFQMLTPEDIRELPAPVFLKMDEETALEHSRQAMFDENRAKAEAILDRFDTLQEQAAPADESEPTTAPTEPQEDEENVVTSTAAGMLDPFTDEETTEDDIGGYAYDLAFIIDSLTSKTIYIVGVFMAVLGGSFLALYQGGLGVILAQFVDRVPPEVLAEVTDDDTPTDEITTELINDLGIVIALHPVEVLIFMVKVSTILAFIAVLPLIGYWAWPAAKQRGLVRGDPRVFLLWGGSLFAGFGFGLFLGFYWIAPSVISYLVADAIRNGMEITYRINSFAWLVIYTTLGVGFLFNIIVTMALFHLGGIISYQTMLARWRPVVVGIFTFAAFASPRGILTMVLLATPIALTYLLGLGILWVLTGGGRFFGGGNGGTAAEPVASD